MAKVAKNLKELFQLLQNEANKSLKREVVETVTQEMSETIKHVTYKQYTPKDYVRRMDNGGLSDVRNYQVEILNDNTIKITNETKGHQVVGDNSDENIDKIIVSGEGYTWKRSHIYAMQPYPRDFYADTVKRLEGNREHLKAFKDGMRRLGYDLK